MKKFYAICMLLSCAVYYNGFCAQNVANDMKVIAPAPAKEVIVPAPEKTVNIAIVDVQEIVLSKHVDKDPVEKLMKFQQDKQNELQKLGKEIQTAEQELQAQASTLKPEVLKDKQAALEEKRQTAQLKLQRANNEVREEEMKTRAEVFQAIQSYAQDWMKQNPTIDVVFERGGGILAHSNRVDMTSDLGAFVEKDIKKKEASKKAAEGKKEAKETKEAKKK
jgi:Skp family chaperone for outer membrane proteins